VKTVLKNIWKPSKGLVIRETDPNLFPFQFFSKKDKEYVLKEGPWAFDGHIPLVQEWTGLEQFSEIKFDVTRFWVKAYDVPGVRQMKTFTQFLGNRIGKLVECDETHMIGADKFLCFGVDVDINKPIHWGVTVIIGGSNSGFVLNLLSWLIFAMAASR